MQQKSHVCRWNRSHVRGHVKLVRAASSHNTAESRKTKEGSNLNINVHKPFCVLLVKASTQDPSSDTTVGERCMGNKNFSYVHQDQSRRCIYEGRVESTYPCRSLSGSVQERGRWSRTRRDSDRRRS